MAIYSNRAAAPVAFAPANAPTFEVPFVPKSWLIINEGTAIANYIEFSFDGVTVHGRLVPTILSGVRLTQSVQKLWVRGVGGSTAQIIVEDTSR